MKSLLILVGLVFAAMAVWPGWADVTLPAWPSPVAATATAAPAGRNTRPLQPRRSARKATCACRRAGHRPDTAGASSTHAYDKALPKPEQP